MTSPESAGIDRRAFLRHAAWAGAGVAVAVSGGVVTTELITHHTSHHRTADFTFAQISDSHIGFMGKANPDVSSTFQQTINLVNGLAKPPDFVIHTGDLTHFSTAAQFDQVKQMMSSLQTGQVLYIPGEHDAVDDDGQKYLSAFGASTQGRGWFSFNHQGVHFIAVVNTTGQQILGHLGSDQLAWIKTDVARLSSDTPIVLFSHIPLFEMYTPWGWGTDDAPQALSYLQRFSSVTCLNGHVHQIMSRTEGKVTFHSCAATAYPLPHPGQAPAPNPVVLPPGQLPSAIGIRSVDYQSRAHDLSLQDRFIQQTH
jgi:3',5'-cyclic AMP phosphodiesterase CpdA